MMMMMMRNHSLHGYIGNVNLFKCVVSSGLPVNFGV